jgi:hypothetical protein
VTAPPDPPARPAYGQRRSGSLDGPLHGALRDPSIIMTKPGETADLTAATSTGADASISGELPTAHFSTGHGDPKFLPPSTGQFL